MRILYLSVIFLTSTVVIAQSENKESCILPSLYCKCPMDACVYIQNLKERNSAPSRLDEPVDYHNSLLIVGTPGNGKTSLAAAIVGGSKSTPIVLRGEQFNPTMVNEPLDISDELEEAEKHSHETNRISVVVIDEIDDLDANSASILRGLMDKYRENPRVSIIAITNRPETLSGSLTSRFAGVIRMVNPDAEHRNELAREFARAKKCRADAAMLQYIAKRTKGNSVRTLKNSIEFPCDRLKRSGRALTRDEYDPALKIHQKIEKDQLNMHKESNSDFIKRWGEALKPYVEMGAIAGGGVFALWVGKKALDAGQKAGGAAWKHGGKQTVGILKQGASGSGKAAKGTLKVLWNYTGGWFQ